MKIHKNAVIPLIFLVSLATFSQVHSETTLNKKKSDTTAKKSTKKLEYKRLYPGMLFAEFKEIYPDMADLCMDGNCHQYSILSDQSRRNETVLGYAKGNEKEKTLTTIGNECLVFDTYLTFSNDVLESLKVSFIEGCFDHVKSAFQDKYGKPFNVTKNKVVSGSGGQYENIDVAWRDSNSVLSIERFYGRIDRSVVRLSSQSSLNRKVENSEEKKKAGI